MASPPGTTTKPSPGRGKNRWTYEQHLFLDVLWSPPFAQLSGSQRAAAFNHIFSAHLAKCGVHSGLVPRTISAQYVERTHVHKASWAASWGRICAVPKVDVGLRGDSRERIDQFLEGGGGGDDTIRVAGRVTPPVTPMHHRRRREDVYASPGPSTRKKHSAAQLPGTPLRHGEDSYVTPGPSTRKRRAITPIVHPVFDDNEDDEDYTEPPNPKRAKATSPTVMIPRSPPGGNSQLIRRQQPQTPQTTPAKKNKKTGWRPGRREERATVLFHRRVGAPIWLTPEEYAEAMLPLVNVTEEAAHPNPPALLFRYWHGKSHGLNSSTEFVSGRFARALIEPRPPPDCDVLDWNDVAHHLNNRGHDQDGEPSPFISTSNLLVWVIRMALKKADDTAYISVIDTSKLDHKSIYHVPPFYEQLKKKRCFFKGGFNYRGSHEVRNSFAGGNLIWHTIPSQAIIKTFSLQDLVTFATSSRPLQKTLRLDQLATAKSSATDIIKDLKQGEVKISSRVAAAMAQFVAFLGLDHSSSRDTLARAVMEVAQGWALKADGESQEKADHFVKVFQDRSEEYVGFGDQFKLKHAFLHGIEWSCGDLNVSLKGREAHRQMKARASKRGLADTGRVLNGELDRARLEAVLFERREERLQVRPSDRLLEGPEEVDDDGEELALGIGGLGVQGLEQEGEFIRYEG